MQVEVADKIVNLRNVTRQSPKVHTITSIVNGETESTIHEEEDVEFAHDVDESACKDKDNSMVVMDGIVEESTLKTEHEDELGARKEVVNTTNGDIISLSPPDTDQLKRHITMENEVKIPSKM